LKIRNPKVEPERSEDGRSLIRIEHEEKSSSAISASSFVILSLSKDRLLTV